MKLHLGCANKIFDGWVNLDILEAEGVDIIDDASVLSKIDNNSCDIIYASMLLEHFSRNNTVEILKLWRSKLKHGGILRLSVPDFSKIVQRYAETNDIDEIMGIAIGGHKDDFDKHGAIFDKKSLSAMLESVKFKNIKEWSWREVDHGKYDDYSQSYLPHMQKEDGLLMSLNLEAVK
jgi:predicted SAM-dependent methyltransferase